MEYLITAIASATFVCICLLNKSKNRESFTCKLSDEQYSAKINKIIQDMPLPTQGCKKDYDIKKFRRTITLAYIVAKVHQKRNRGKHLDGFTQIITDNKSTLKALYKKDFSKLADLPSTNNQAKVETIARTILENNGYLVINDKIDRCFELFNSKGTISFDEIASFDLAMYYILIEKLYFLSKRATSLIKVENYSLKVAKHHGRYVENKFYKQVSKNNLFLHFVATARGEECTDASLVFFDVIQNLTFMTTTIFDGIRFVENADFSKFYSPLEILENYEVFSQCSDFHKKAFLAEFSSQATSVNMDEYAYVCALKKYTDREETRYTRSFHVNLGFIMARVLHFEHNLKTLSRALTSRFAMDLIFGVKISKRILKRSVFKNTFAPQQQISTIKLGISLKDSKLMLNPILPQNVSKVAIDLTEKNTNHHIIIEKADTKELYCNGTKYDGISVIKLGNIPLNIHLKTPQRAKYD